MLLERVVLELVARAESVFAEGARVRQNSVLAHFVSAQLAGLHKLPIAQLARVRLLAGVGARMALKKFARAKPLAAQRALVGPLTRSMHQGAVPRQVSARAQLLAALVALEKLTLIQVLLFDVRRQENLKKL